MKILKLLRVLSLPYVRARPLKVGLTLLGMALGVAAFTAIDLCQNAILDSIGGTISSISGNTDVSIGAGSRSPHNDDFPKILAHAGVRAATPLVRVSAACGKASDQKITVLGIDPLTRGHFFDEGLSKNTSDANAAWSFLSLLREDDVLVMGPDTARSCGVAPEKAAEFKVQGKIFSFRPLLAPGLPEGLAFVDVATAQEKLKETFEDGISQDLTQIDVRLDAALSRDPAAFAAWKKEFQAAFPDLSLTTPQESTSKGRKLLEAFRVNLTALGLVSMFVSVFLVYNATSLALLKRRREIGILRGLGLTRREAAVFFTAENFFFGIMAVILGGALGQILAGLISKSVFQTASDLYTHAAAAVPALTARTAVLSFALGLLGVALGTILPLAEVLSITPAEATRRLSYETRIRRRAPRLAALSAIFFSLTFIFMKIATVDRPYYSFAAALTALLGFLFLTPFFARLVLMPLERIARATRSGLVLVATSQVRENPYRSGVVIAALSMAVGLWLGVGLMVTSFRANVADWIAATIQGDAYLIRPESGSGSARAALPRDFLERLASLPHLKRLETNRTETVQYRGEDTTLSAIALDALLARGTFRILEGDRKTFVPAPDPVVPDAPTLPIRAALAESFAHRRHLSVGDDFDVTTSWGTWSLKVGAVLYDYSSERGLIYINDADFRRLTRDDRVHAAALFFDSPSATDVALNLVKSWPDMPPALDIQKGPELRAKILTIFDRTFLVTEILKWVALVVAFLGVLTTIALLAEERRWEYGLLLAQGLSRRRLGLLGVWQGLVLAVIGEGLGLMIGLALCHVIIAEVHYNFFGWTIFFAPDWWLLPRSAALTLAAGSLAGLLTLRKLQKITPAEALRYDQ